jgi:hypothetical protein
MKGKEKRERRKTNENDEEGREISVGDTSHRRAAVWSPNT